MVQVYGSKILITGCLNSSAKFAIGCSKQGESLQCLQEGANNQVKVDHLAVQKILTLLLIQKSQGVSKPGKLKKRKNLLNFKRRYSSKNSGKEQ